MSDNDKKDPRLAEYEALKAINPIVAARTALAEGTFRPQLQVDRTGEPAVLEGDVTPHPADPRAEDRATYEALRKQNPIIAARFALQTGLFK